MSLRVNRDADVRPPEFIRQTDTPLFPEVFWNRPTMRSRGGRLLIIGGQKSQFIEVQSVYQMAEAAGIGESTIAMPDSLQKLVGEVSFAQFVPSSGSGSLGKAALGELLYLSEDADTVLIGANITNNAETAVMVDSLIAKLDSRMVITQETIAIMRLRPELITGDPKTLVVTHFDGLYDLARHHKMPVAIRTGGGVLAKLELVRQLASVGDCSYLAFDNETIIVGAEDRLSLTNLDKSSSDLDAAITGVGATFWTQQPSQPFKALTTAAFIISQACLDPDMSLTTIEKQIRTTITKYDQ